MNHLCQAHPIIGFTNKKNNFREAVVRCPLFGRIEEKSGHQRAGFPVKTGMRHKSKQMASATENIPPSLEGKGEMVE